MPKLIVELRPSEAVRLARLARAERRDAQSQAAFVVVEWLKAQPGATTVAPGGGQPDVRRGEAPDGR